MRRLPAIDASSQEVLAALDQAIATTTSARARQLLQALRDDCSQVDFAPLRAGASEDLSPAEHHARQRWMI